MREAEYVGTAGQVGALGEGAKAPRQDRAGTLGHMQCLPDGVSDHSPTGCSEQEGLRHQIHLREAASCGLLTNHRILLHLEGKNPHRPA